MRIWHEITGARGKDSLEYEAEQRYRTSPNMAARVLLGGQYLDTNARPKISTKDLEGISGIPTEVLGKAHVRWMGERKKVQGNVETWARGAASETLQLLTTYQHSPQASQILEDAFSAWGIAPNFSLPSTEVKQDLARQFGKFYDGFCADFSEGGMGKLAPSFVSHLLQMYRNVSSEIAVIRITEAVRLLDPWLEKFFGSTTILDTFHACIEAQLSYATGRLHKKSLKKLGEREEGFLAYLHRAQGAPPLVLPLVKDIPPRQAPAMQHPLAVGQSSPGTSGNRAGVFPLPSQTSYPTESHQAQSFGHGVQRETDIPQRAQSSSSLGSSTAGRAIWADGLPHRSLPPSGQSRGLGEDDEYFGPPPFSLVEETDEPADASFARRLVNSGNHTLVRQDYDPGLEGQRIEERAMPYRQARENLLYALAQARGGNDIIEITTQLGEDLQLNPLELYEAISNLARGSKANDSSQIDDILSNAPYFSEEGYPQFFHFIRARATDMVISQVDTSLQTLGILDKKASVLDILNKNDSSSQHTSVPANAESSAVRNNFTPQEIDRLIGYIQVVFANPRLGLSPVSLRDFEETARKMNDAPTMFDQLCILLRETSLERIAAYAQEIDFESSKPRMTGKSLKQPDAVELPDADVATSGSRPPVSRRKYRAPTWIND